MTASHCTLEVGELSSGSRFSDPSRPSVLENRVPYGNNLPPTLALFRSVTTTDPSAALEGCSQNQSDERPPHVESDDLQSGGGGVTAL